MLLGYALPRREDELFMGILPYDRIEGSEASVLGNFAHLADSLFALEKDLGKPRSLGEWGDFLTRVLDDFFLPTKRRNGTSFLFAGYCASLAKDRDSPGLTKKSTWR